MIEPTAVPVISTARSGAFEKRRRQMLNPFLMRLYYLGKLPLAFVAGLRLRAVGAGHGAGTVPPRVLPPALMRPSCPGKLPLAFVAGLRLRELDAGHAVVTVPYGWRTTNPF